MACKSAISAAWLLVVVAFAYPAAAGMRVTGSDATASFLAIGISKSIIVDFPTDITEVLVADPSIVKAVAHSQRQVYILGASIGQTNVYFFGPDGRQVNGLNVAVVFNSQQAELEQLSPANTVMMFFGPLVDEAGYGTVNSSVYGTWASLSCSAVRCYDARKPGADQPPGTQNINITGSGAGGTSVAVGK